MTTYTLTDARHPAIVARALDLATTTGRGLPRLTFGGSIEACLTADGFWQVNARTHLTPHHPTMMTTIANNLTNARAVELINKIAQDTPYTIGEVKRARATHEAATRALHEAVTGAIAHTGNLAAVARAAGITRTTAYRWVQETA